MRRRKKFRIIVRPWTPRKIPYQIPTSLVREVLENAYPKLKSVVYIGWIRRVIEDQKQLLFLVATGGTSIEARKAFKQSGDFGENVWVVKL